MLPPGVYKILLSSPADTARGGFTHVEIHRSRGSQNWQAAKYTTTQVFHENLDAAGQEAFLSAWFGGKFLQLHAWDGEYEYSRRLTKKGRLLENKRKAPGPKRMEFSQGFDRAKNVALQPNELPIPVRDMKLAQVNQFLEIISHELRGLPAGTKINIIDFGCGKSYLTFAVHYYMKEKRGFDTEILGLDLRGDVVESCRAAAEEMQISTLEFKTGAIDELAEPMPRWHEQGVFNIVISLHACDTATDDALTAALRWNTDLICAVPCCQHSLRRGMKLENGALRLITRYPILEERFAALASDALRAARLEERGYSVDIVEFAPLSHTAKNLMIRARRSAGGYNKNDAAAEFEGLLTLPSARAASRTGHSCVRPAG